MNLSGLASRALGIFVVGYIFVFTVVQSPKIFDYYRVSDDVRQQIYPLYLARDHALFRQDLLTHYFLSHTPPFYYYAHYPLAWLIDPVVLSKLSQFGLLIVVLVFLFKIGKRLYGPILGWSLVFVFVHSPDLAGLTDGGLPRGWAVPGTIMFIWAVLEERTKVALAAVTISGLFYPPIFLVLGPAYGVWCVWTRRFTAWNFAAAGLIGVGFWPMVFRDDSIGRIVTYAQAVAMPEWHNGSRFPFIPIPPLWRLAPRYLAISYVPGRFFDTLPYWILLGIGLLALLPPAKATDDPKSLASRTAAEQRRFRFLGLGVPLLLSLLMYQVSSQLAFRLHIPDRNIKYTLPVLGAILITAGLFDLFTWALGRLHASKWVLAFPVLLVAGLFGLVGNGLYGNLNLWADQRFAWKLYAFVETLPKDSLLAGPPTEMDNIPLFSRRTVYVSDEAVQPLFDRYYRDISERVRRFYRAYYAHDISTVAEFASSTSVDYMVVRTDDFASKFTRVKYFHEPFNSFIKELKGDRPVTEFVFANPPGSAVVYSDGFFKVIDLRLVQKR